MDEAKLAEYAGTELPDEDAAKLRNAALDVLFRYLLTPPGIVNPDHEASLEQAEFAIKVLDFIVG